MRDAICVAVLDVVAELRDVQVDAHKQLQILLQNQLSLQSEGDARGSRICESVGLRVRAPSGQNQDDAPDPHMCTTDKQVRESHRFAAALGVPLLAGCPGGATGHRALQLCPCNTCTE